MHIDKHIDKDNWDEIKDILPQITEIKSLDLGWVELTEFPKMSHITNTKYFQFNYEQLTSLIDYPIVDGNYTCFFKPPVTSFNISIYGDILAFNKIHKYSNEKKISLLEAQVELYNQQDEEILAIIDKLPDLVAYIRLKELNKLLCA